MKFERIVKVTPAFDKRNDNPTMNYGIGACRIVFIVKGEKGAVQFMIGTDWFLPEVQRENRDWLRNYESRFDHIRPDGWDVGYHAKEPQHDDQTHMNCDLFDSGYCYYDGSSLRADEWIPEFLSGGTEWLWPRLEQEYRDRFVA